MFVIEVENNLVQCRRQKETTELAREPMGFPPVSTQRLWFALLPFVDKQHRLSGSIPHCPLEHRQGEQAQSKKRTVAERVPRQGLWQRIYLHTQQRLQSTGEPFDKRREAEVATSTLWRTDHCITTKPSKKARQQVPRIPQWCNIPSSHLNLHVLRQAIMLSLSNATETPPRRNPLLSG